MKEIPLTRGKAAIVDDADYERLAPYKWGALKHRWSRTWYAARGYGPRGSMRHILMHRQILDAPASLEVDHRNGDGLCNVRGNLRLATRQQNGRNITRLRLIKTSQYLGVSWDSSRRRWLAQIGFNGRNNYIGRFLDEEDAARAYAASAIELFGEFASPLILRTEVKP